MPETLRSSSLPATPSNTGEGGGLDRAESWVRVSLFFMPSFLVPVCPERATEAHFTPQMLPWVEVTRAIRGFPASVSGGQLGNLGFRKESVSEWEG